MLSLRTSRMPAGLNLTRVAKPAYAFCAPLEKAMTLLVGAADGVASNVAVKFDVWVANGVFIHPPPLVAVTHWDAAWPASTTMHKNVDVNERRCMSGFPSFLRAKSL